MSAEAQNGQSNGELLLQVKDLKKHFPIERGLFLKRAVDYVRAVDGVSFDIERGETMGLVGESGCGKSTTGRTILRLYPPTAGEVYFGDVEINSLSGRELHRLRPRMQMIFQDPLASLNPRMTVEGIVGEPLQIHFRASRKERKERVAELLELVGLNPRFSTRYPHEFSGGQRQRIGVARALALQPEFIVCDEPISALDVSVQAQVVNLLEELQDNLQITYLFIAHDLNMVRYISDRVAVMYLGKLVEMATSDELYAHPLHPYTQALMSAAPVPDPVVEGEAQRIILEGDVPSPVNPPSGCRFHTRCPIAEEICSQEEPLLRELAPGHTAACHLI
ncbi:MAG: dipeptide ABC transporter ATP-binding protein [Chloroflexi bacterium]|nr:dipeptide ABC transporter ATP-binding protein [Chloroflexota bacterium]